MHAGNMSMWKEKYQIWDRLQTSPRLNLRPYLYLRGGNILLLLAGTFDDVRKVADGNGNGEIEGRQHDGAEDPPSGQTGDKGTRSSRLVKFFSESIRRTLTKQVLTTVNFAAFAAAATFAGFS